MDYASAYAKLYDYELINILLESEKYNAQAIEMALKEVEKRGIRPLLDDKWREKYEKTVASQNQQLQRPLSTCAMCAPGRGDNTISFDGDSILHAKFEERITTEGLKFEKREVLDVYFPSIHFTFAPSDVARAEAILGELDDKASQKREIKKNGRIGKNMINTLFAFVLIGMFLIGMILWSVK